MARSEASSSKAEKAIAASTTPSRLHFWITDTRAKHLSIGEKTIAIEVNSSDVPPATSSVSLKLFKLTPETPYRSQYLVASPQSLSGDVLKFWGGRRSIKFNLELLDFGNFRIQIDVLDRRGGPGSGTILATMFTGNIRVSSESEMADIAKQWEETGSPFL
ncbi:hypothetical protein M426DRAFT_17158 [Hypoxylon sp. CI-4A]|nr:hypothetical protein M426DRAFT_17158 [Hypoxylon sp. CI-4A]